MRYTMIVDGVEGNHGVVFPDFPGCISVGATVDEAVRMGEEALSLHLEGMEEGSDLPKPSTVDDALAFYREHFADGEEDSPIVVLVEAPE